MKGAALVTAGVVAGLTLASFQAGGMHTPARNPVETRVAHAQVTSDDLRRRLALERREHAAEVTALRSARLSGWTPGMNRLVAQGLAAERGWTGQQWRCLDQLVWRESRYIHTARNPSSGAYGIPQSLPGRKMATIAADWQSNPVTQARWMLRYVSGRYGTPCDALAHSNARGWY